MTDFTTLQQQQTELYERVLTQMHDYGRRLTYTRHALTDVRRALAMPEPHQGMTAVKLGRIREAVERYETFLWNDWTRAHPECSQHEPGHRHHGGNAPDGCGHCTSCHDDLDLDGPRCGHYAGCPGC